MQLPEAIKMVLYYRQCPLTSQQIAYFLCLNNIVRTVCLQDLVHRVEEEVFCNPAHFAIVGELVTLSSWRQAEQEVIQHVFDVVQGATRLRQEVSQDQSFSNNLVLALLLYKRLSDIRRSQQHGTPIVPAQLKYNCVLKSTSLTDLPSRVSEVMEYIERTDSRLTDIFFSGKETLSSIGEEQQAAKLYEVMSVLAELKLDEEQLPTSLFHAIFSRMFWRNVKQTSSGLDSAF